MKKHLLQSAISFLLIILFSQSANAQLGIVKKPGITFGGNLIYAMPKSTFNESYKFGGGGEIFAGVGLGSTFITVSMGTLRFHAQKSNPAGAITIVPTKVGLKKYFFLKKVFINGDIGSAKIKTNNESTSAFTAGFGGGVRLLGIEAAVYFNTFKNNIGYSTSGYSNNVQAKVGWRFTL